MEFNIRSSASVFSVSTLIKPVFGLVLLLLVFVTEAEEHNAEIAGGTLDLKFTGADVYQEIPRAANVPDFPSCHVAAQYVELTNSGKFNEVASLFADDAIILEPSTDSKRIIQGRHEVDEFYKTRITTMRPNIIAVAYIGNESDCIIELAVRINIHGKPRYVLVSVDHFTLGSTGKVSRMVAFSRPPRKLE